ncbi:MAG: peptidylprolyl isomerase [Opitutae bacterium]|jgi:cyclophilin family peptidyl-prolyl cis-trans isomerase|nr:peptidylprolyl isomerase [Verrucomicrobiota bacterium]NDH17061.1 peptidylprolyl isomerase [Opitutae bacterium]
MKYLAYFALLLPFIVSEAKPTSESTENVIVIELKDGPVVIETFPDVAPKHVERITKLAQAGKYDGVAFHRVIEGFMAQTGDVQFGNVKDFSTSRVGTGGSDLPDLKEEFNDKKHERGTCSMARSSSPNSANSQFFICFEPAPFLDRQYTVWGKVIEGMELVDKIKMGSSRNNGSVNDPDHMIKVTVGRPVEDSKNSEEE